MLPESVNLSEKLSLFTEQWSPKVIAEMDGFQFRLAKLKGDFVWHNHTDTDETFIILDGKMILHFRDHSVELNGGEMVVIPKGVEHKPTSPEGYKALLIEPEDVPNTGNVKSEVTINKIEWI